jgi:hypothetical protein
MKFVDTAAGVAKSAHGARAVKLLKILNLVGTVRGALTTVLLAASAIGGAATVNTVRQDIAHDRATPYATVASRSATPTATPLTARALHADMQKQLDANLAAAARAVDDLRRVAVLSAARLDELLAESKQKLQARYELGSTQLASLIEGGAVSSESGAPPTAPPSPSVIAANALLQVITSDLNQIVVQATRAATTQPTPIPRTPAPTPPPATPTAPPRTPSPSPRTPSPSPTAMHTPTPKPTP